MRTMWKQFASRRIAIVMMAGLLAAPAAAFADEGISPADWLFAVVSHRAAELASTPYAPSDNRLPAVFDGLDYDAYRKLRPMPETTQWGEAGNPFGVLPLPRGGLYLGPVGVHIVSPERGIASLGSTAHIDFVDFPTADADERSRLGLSGWRAITKPGIAGEGYEFAVFQGGTYFRVVGQSQVYGVSARAFAVGAGQAATEEFPHFRDFWIFKPQGDDSFLDVIALADSQSATAAFRFKLHPGVTASVDVTGEIHPRVDIPEIGFAPLSSMFLRGSADRQDRSDSRPQVHDSEGLSILSANGEHVWRPLANPARLQISAFAGAPARFGLEQRSRAPAAYADSEARYGNRPSIWIQPAEDWGPGDIRLVEIPTANEYADNIAVFWRPAEGLAAGKPLRLSYRLDWGDLPPSDSVARVNASLVELAPESSDTYRITVDYSGPALAEAGPIRPDVWAGVGDISNIRIEQTGAAAFRLSFDLKPGQAQSVELHAALADQNSQLTETWLFRWTPA